MSWQAASALKSVHATCHESEFGAHIDALLPQSTEWDTRSSRTPESRRQGTGEGSNTTAAVMPRGGTLIRPQSNKNNRWAAALKRGPSPDTRKCVRRANNASRDEAAEGGYLRFRAVGTLPAMLVAARRAHRDTIRARQPQHRATGSDDKQALQRALKLAGRAARRAAQRRARQANEKAARVRPKGHRRLLRLASRDTPAGAARTACGTLRIPRKAIAAWARPAQGSNEGTPAFAEAGLQTAARCYPGYTTDAAVPLTLPRALTALALTAGQVPIVSEAAHDAHAVGSIGAALQAASSEGWRIVQLPSDGEGAHCALDRRRAHPAALFIYQSNAAHEKCALTMVTRPDADGLLVYTGAQRLQTTYSPSSLRGVLQLAITEAKSAAPRDGARRRPGHGEGWAPPPGRRTSRGGAGPALLWT